MESRHKQKLDRRIGKKMMAMMINNKNEKQEEL